MGPTEFETWTTLRRFAAGVRGAALTTCLLVGLFEVPNHWPPALLIVTGAAAWNAIYAVLLFRRPAAVTGAVDVGVLVLLALTQRWTVPATAAADSTGFVLAAMTLAVVTVQWSTTFRTGAAVAVTLFGAYVAGAWWAVGQAEAHRLTMVLWLIPQALLSRLCVAAVVAAARAADRVEDVQRRRRIAVQVEAARRHDAQAFQAHMHDTVASTLLMVGVGAVKGAPDWLRDQAVKDLGVLRGNLPEAPADLAAVLRQEIARSPVRVTHEPLPAVRLPAEVAAALAGIVREALTNVYRHAGVDRATVSVSADPLQVRVADAGCGFAAGSGRSPHHRGVTDSIVNRARAAGGQAWVETVPGAGTVVVAEFAGV